MGEEQAPSVFDFAAHAQKATAEYLAQQSFYSDLANAVGRIVEECIGARGIKVQTVQNRAKSPQSFSEKAAIPSENDPNTPRYPKPLQDITDLAGVRIITYFPDTLDEIDALLQQEFQIVERSDKGALLLAEGKFGYQSIHYLVRLKSERARLSEYKRYDGAVVEVQVRTVLQHAWAEIEHDIQYKSAETIPAEIRRRFMALAGMLEIADREFQAINLTARELETQVEEKVEKGDVAGLEITPRSLKLFLNRQLGVDYRISDWSYDWTARLLKQLGFRDIEQVEKAITPYSDNQLSDLAYGSRQGQVTRFELMLLAAMGPTFIQRHLWNSDWFRSQQERFLNKFKDAGLATGVYDPDDDAVAKGDLAKGWPELIRKAQNEHTIWLNEKEWPRTHFGSEINMPKGETCHDCGVLRGQLHVNGCDNEECPSCKNQLISCDCGGEDEAEDLTGDDPIVDDEPPILQE